MAIERLKKVSLVVPLEDKRRLFDRLYDLKILHIVDAFSRVSVQDLKRNNITTEETDYLIHRLGLIISTFNLFNPEKKGLIEGFFPTPRIVSESTLEKLLPTFELEPLFDKCQFIMEQHTFIEKRLSEIKEEIPALSPFTELRLDLEGLKRLKKTTIIFGTCPGEEYLRMTSDPQAKEILTCQLISVKEREHKVLIACLNEERDSARGLLKGYKFTEIPLPDIQGRVSGRIAALELENRDLLSQKDGLAERVSGLSKEYRDKVEIMMGYHEDQRSKTTTEGKSALSKRVMVIIGYIRAIDIQVLDRLLSREFPDSSIVYDDPKPSDAVPVSISLNPFFRPVQLLVNMFGLPNYFSFDPTPFITLSFLAFFGICFGDVLYGLMLIGFSVFMMMRFRSYEDTRDFFKLFFYAGISTTIFGALTGSWGGDLYRPEYLGENNIVYRLMNLFVMIDPLSKPIAALILAIGIGIINQFYGIILKMYGEIRRGNIGNAVFDGGLWLVVLPCFILLASSLFTEIPGWLFKTGGMFFLAGAIGLIATQGRGEVGLPAKIITGIVSLYGIVGSYGCMSFVGDILSYSRLLALGLTTSIVAMSFNMIANLFKPLGFAGMILFMIVLIIGHLLNFVMSIIGSFVHPARLIFLEFFGRFYEGGGTRFQPFGFQGGRIRLIKTSE